MIGLLDRREGFSEAAQVLLGSFRKFCQNIKQCIDENPLATPKLLDSAASLVVKLLNRYDQVHLLDIENLALKKPLHRKLQTLKPLAS